MIALIIYCMWAWRATAIGAALGLTLGLIIGQAY